jgi:hypothetical protein
VFRAILEACIPCLIAMLGAFALLAVAIRLSGARFDWKRLRGLHRCQDGGVQSLAFVITLPLFIMIVMFIVQVSQLMVGIMMVHYSAYSAARSASVWLPAAVDGVDQNAIYEGHRDTNENQMNITGFQEIGDKFYLFPSEDSFKYQQIRTAAVLACAPVCPSRNLGIQAGSLTLNSQAAMEATQRMYRSLVPTSASNPRINTRLANKIAYSDLNTYVLVSWRDAKNGSGNRETYRSPTFNPRNHPNPDPKFHWVPGEVGWQDAITVHVFHRFALIPGPGRLLAKHLVPASGLPDNVSDKILVDQAKYSQPVYSVLIPASATVTTEGMKSRQPYLQEAE